jgi:N,N'-diacetyllegionaminate synthase
MKNSQEHVFIIAEAGVNHNGSLELAKKLVDIAIEAGCDCVKFQTFKAERLVSKIAEKADYQKEVTGSNESQLAMIKKLELSYDDFIDLKKYCDAREIFFLSTPFDLESIDFLQKLNVALWKIPSGEITNLPYIIKIAATGKSVILSTGMSTLEEVKVAVSLLKQNNAGELTLLQCNTEYPTPFDDVNLKAMLTMQKELKVKIGYSDHTSGIEVPIAAAALGAAVIEKHFTLDKNMEGPDHKASLEPEELALMVRSIRNIEKAMGTGIKVPSPSEIKNMPIARKSIIAGRNIKKGEIFTEENITIKRPGTGISPMRWFDVLGTTAVQDFEEDALIIL